MTATRFPDSVLAMVSDGVTTAKAFRQHYGFPIQYVSARTGIDVDRLRYIEGGSDASDDEIIAIGKAFEVPHEMFR